MVKPRADALRYAHIYGWDVSPQNVRQMNSSEEILLHEHLCGVWLRPRLSIDHIVFMLIYSSNKIICHSHIKNTVSLSRKDIHIILVISHVDYLFFDIYSTIQHKYSPMMHIPDPAQMPVIDYLFVHGYLTGILRGDIPSIDVCIP